MNEIPAESSNPNDGIGTAWFGILGFVPGDTIMIIPVGSQGGAGFQGQLVALVSDDQGPVAVIIRQREGAANVTVRWAAICMLTRVDKTDEQIAAENAELARIQAEFEAATGISVQDVSDVASTENLASVEAELVGPRA